MKETPLTATHIELNAKMAEFAGYNMPISYSGIIDEHLAVRNKAGLFDVSHMGEFIVKGKKAQELVDKVTSNDVIALKPGEIQYSCLPNTTGGIVDDLLVYRLYEDQCTEGEKAFMLVVNAGNIQKDWDWISSYANDDVKLTNISDQTALLALQGPAATSILSALTTVPVGTIDYYNFAKGTVAGISNVLISATGYTGSGGYELYCDNKDALELWNAIMTQGKSEGLIPAGLGARDTLRLEMGFCLYGNDINDETTPLEAGLGWITKLKKGHFIASDILAAQKSAGVTKKLTAFKMNEKRVPRHGYAILDSEGNTLGEVTSGTMSPSLGYPIGMGYIKTSDAVPGRKIFIDINGKKYAAETVKVPFVKIG